MAIKISRTFVLRRLFQLSGIVPLGTFFLVHMYTNSKATSGEKLFNEAVADLHHTPYLIFIEVFGIFLPLLYHSIYGMWVAAETRANNFNYGYARNWFYTFQRVSGVFLFFFILFHILNLRFGLIPGLNLTPVAGNADQAFDIIQREFQIPAIFALYMLGIAATAWHFGYGVFLFLVDWGIVIGEKAQRYALYGSYAIALGMFAVGANAAYSFVEPGGIFGVPPEQQQLDSVQKVEATQQQ